MRASHEPTWLSWTPGAPADRTPVSESGPVTHRIHNFIVKNEAEAARILHRILAGEDLIAAAFTNQPRPRRESPRPAQSFAPTQQPTPTPATPQATQISDPEAFSELDEDGFVRSQPDTVPNPGAHLRPDPDPAQSDPDAPGLVPAPPAPDREITGYDPSTDTRTHILVPGHPLPPGIAPSAVTIPRPDRTTEVRTPMGGSDGGDRPWTDVRVLAPDGRVLTAYREDADGKRTYRLDAYHTLTVDRDNRYLPPKTPYGPPNVLYYGDPDNVGFVRDDGRTVALTLVDLPTDVPGKALYTIPGDNRLIIQNFDDSFGWVDHTDRPTPLTPAQQSIHIPWTGTDPDGNPVGDHYQDPHGYHHYNLHGRRVTFSPDRTQIIDLPGMRRPLGTPGYYIDDRRPEYENPAWTIPSHRIDLPPGIPALALYRLDDGRLIIVDQTGASHFLDPIPAQPAEGWTAGAIRIFENIAQGFSGKPGGSIMGTKPPRPSPRTTNPNTGEPFHRPRASPTTSGETSSRNLPIASARSLLSQLPRHSGPWIPRFARTGIGRAGQIPRQLLSRADDLTKSTASILHEVSATFSLSPSFAGLPNPLAAVGPLVVTRFNMTMGTSAATSGTPRVPTQTIVMPPHSAANSSITAKFGSAVSNNYKDTFFAANPSLKGKVVVHHAVEQQTLGRYPGLVTEAEIHSLENLRGIPKGRINGRIHLSLIRKAWNRFYKKFDTLGRNPTKQELLDHATYIDRTFGHFFNPPL